MRLVLLCGHALYIRWGTYGRKSRPDGTEIRIQRFFCLVCHHTCSVLPAFLLGHGHYTTATVGPYFEAMAAKPISIADVWETRAISDFPCDLATLYRWFKRLAFRLALLLTLLEKELLDLAPQTSLEALEKLIIKNAAIQQRALAAPSHTDAASTRLSGLTLHALCKSNLWLAKQLIQMTSQLLHTPQDQKLPPLLFLNFFCWQKTGQALLSPLPQRLARRLRQKPHPPPK